MSKPTHTIVIADKAAKKIALDVEQAIEPLLSESRFLASLGMPRIEACANAEDLRKRLKIVKNSYEACLYITDTVGENQLKKNRSDFPLMRVLFHTQSVSDGRLMDLVEVGLVDVPLRKGNPEAFRRSVAQQYELYWNQSVLRPIKQTIREVSSDPTRECYLDDDKNRWLNLNDIYEEIRRNTPLGKKLAELWYELEAIGD